jgi:hypothetical protein
VSLIIGMIYFIGAMIVLTIIFRLMRIRATKAVAKASSNDLRSGIRNGEVDFDSVAGSLDMIIRSKTLPPGFNKSKLEQVMLEINGSWVSKMFSVHNVEKNSNGDHIVIAETSQQIPGNVNEEYLHASYPCLLLVSIDDQAHQLIFYSSLPENKDHQHLLEDLADYIHRSATAV